MTKEAATHTFHKMRTPGKCAVCDTYAFIGLECAQCGLVFHKKCLENIKTPCTRSRVLANTKELPSPMKTFGVRFSEDGGVPVLVSKCVKEINRRGLRVKGIYRVSGVKSKMENLCQEFETNAESVDLSTQPPHLIASVLKLYIRQLPEPLMTTKLYSELIQLAKESDHLPHLRIDDCEPETKEEFRNFLDKLQETIKKLPRSNYLTTATLIKHLHKVSLHEEYNQMNSNNLAIVFGPTILRLESTIPGSSLSSLVDMSHQSRIVALLIVNPQLFDDVPDEPDDELENVSIEENDSSLPSSPVEKSVLTDSKDENGVCNIDSETWVGDEVPSPKEHCSFQLTDITSTRRAQIFDTMRISESDNYEGKAAISLLGSSEEKDTNFDFPVNRKISSERDTEPSSYYSKQTDVVQNGVLDENSFVSSYEDSSTLSSVGSLSNQNSTEFQTSKRGDDSEVELPQSNFGSTKDKMDFDGNRPRRRSKAFSAGKKNSEMLAKRGSALMNTYMVENNTSTVESDNQEGEISLENQSNGELLVIASETNSNEATDSDITPVQTETEGQVVSGKSPFLEMKAPIALRSENQVNINTLYKNTPSRKRNATYEIDRRRNGTSRPERQNGILLAIECTVHVLGIRASRLKIKSNN
ncbi:rho GTPase-activating protein 29-like [Xenia sp. Carnegie-2017]|uniref:rho GTPase-activating protein 29-like n=1 Tax=Xenia sp. Carnegie-2017 TaxID=2897299 RepID=UPI001F03BE74|nr:rho GTPase-activating protein 29-like [Xenia sp. Carnegie-2017]